MRIKSRCWRFCSNIPKKKKKSCARSLLRYNPTWNVLCFENSLWPSRVVTSVGGVKGRQMRPLSPHSIIIKIPLKQTFPSQRLGCWPNLFFYFETTFQVNCRYFQCNFLKCYFKLSVILFWRYIFGTFFYSIFYPFYLTIFHTFHIFRPFR